jgi:putative phosphoesterase
MPVLGLVSDTHMPDRLAALPDGLFAALRGVDLVLHAGDVGELWVLDRLSTIAPVVAVHGNDDSAESQRELPYQQVVVAAGKRVLLCHGHHPDRAEEMASRRGDDWPPKLERWAGMARGSAATVFVSGHTHVALVHEQDGVLLVNPGAIASPNFATRQLRRSVARLHLDAEGGHRVEHVDVDTGESFEPLVDLSAGFRVAHERGTASILEPRLAPLWDDVRGELMQAVPVEVLRDVVAPVAHRVWDGRRAAITCADLREAVEAEARIPAELRTRIAARLAGAGR